MDIVRINNRVRIEEPMHIVLLDRTMDHLHLDEFITISFWTVLKKLQGYTCVLI